MKNALRVIGIVGFIVLASLTEAAEWVKYDTTQGLTLYYDASSIRQPSKDIVSVDKI